MGFSAQELERFRGATVPDLLGPGLRLLFVGINPGLWTAAVQAHFARPGNRFYPALLAAGIVDRRIDASAGMSDPDCALLVDRGIGITNLVPRATARASEVSPAELVEGAARLRGLVAEQRPRVVAICGITAYRTAFARPKTVAGPQHEAVGAAQLWVVPNPSGLNAHETVTSLATAYRAAAEAARVTAPGGGWAWTSPASSGSDHSREERPPN